MTDVIKSAGLGIDRRVRFADFKSSEKSYVKYYVFNVLVLSRRRKNEGASVTESIIRWFLYSQTS